MRIRQITAALVVTALPAVAVAQTGGTPDGRKTFETVCVMCHSVSPPPKMAPPMAMVSQHYRLTFDSEPAAIDAMTRYILAPDASRSSMPSQVIAQFGMMPKPPVSDAQARAAATYVLSLSTPAGGTGASR